MTIYNYVKAVLPCIGGINTDVQASAMTDKSYEYARWDEDEKVPANSVLSVYFTNSLSPADKAILDAIIAALAPSPAPSPPFLGEGSVSLTFVSNSRVEDAYIKIASRFSNVRGAVLPCDMTLKALSVSEKAPSVAHTIHVRRNGNNISLASVSLTHTERKKYVVVEAKLDAGDEVQVYVAGSALESMVVLWLEGV